ncbi:MAG: hypothetical protein N0C90_24485, partial [Candidatus Thiodiazotropha endolucinida]|nr:hypothetical protein [Candidatus Thiodiazotropha taylori]MCW4264509.1 hypothetical protein [Candidatus Thiodiazotropha endolucinida]
TISTPILLWATSPIPANSVDPDQVASEEAIRSGSTPSDTQSSNTQEQTTQNNPTGPKPETGVAQLNIQQEKGQGK